MVKFYYRDIKVEAIVKMTRDDYRDANNVGRTRFYRNVKVRVSFWNFCIDDDLCELAMVKSSLSYYMQAFWKRSSKQGSKIELATALEHQFPKQTLGLTARQKNNKHSLEVNLVENGLQSECMYLTAQEVILLDVAISKAIALLTPQTLEMTEYTA